MMMTTTVERTTEKTIDVNIVDGENVRDEMAIKGCDGTEDGIVPSSTGVETPAATTTTTTSVCFAAESTMEQFVDRLAAAGGDSIVRDNAKDGFVISTPAKAKDVDQRFLLPTTTTAAMTEAVKVNRDFGQVRRESDSMAMIQDDKSDVGGKRIKEEADGVTGQFEITGNGNDVVLTEDIIDGFAFASFVNYGDLEEWVHRKEEKQRQLLQLTDNAGGSNGTSTKASFRAATTATPEATPRRKCKRNKENKMATLAMSMKETDGLSGGNVSAVGAVNRFGSPSAMFQSGASTSNSAKLPFPDSILNQHSPQPMVSIVDSEGSSPSLLRPKSSSAIADSLLSGQSIGSSITSARVKRPANGGVGGSNNSNNACGDHATDLCVPAKVPKRETVDTVPGAARELHDHQRTHNRSSSPPRARSNASETNDSKRHVGSFSATINNKKIPSQSHQNQLTNMKMDALSPSYVSGNSTFGENKIFYKESTAAIQNSLPLPSGVTPLIAALAQAATAKPTTAPSNNSVMVHSQQPHAVNSDPTTSNKPLGGLIPNSAAIFSPLGGGLFSTPAAAATGSIGAPAYFHTEMHQHQHTHMHQYPPFLSPFLNAAAAAGLSGLPGMVGLPSSYNNIPGFPMTTQVPGLPALPTQVPNANAQATKKKGKWCAMHVQIAWDIYNKTALRRDKKGDEGAHGAGASSASASNPASTSTSNSNSSSSTGAISSHKLPGVRPTGLPMQAVIGNAIMDKSKPSIPSIPDPARDQRRREKERLKQNSLQRPGELENSHRVPSVQNGMQPPSSGGRESTKLPIEQRYNNGNASMGHRASSAVPHSPASTMLPLKTDHTSSLPVFQDGLLSRQQMYAHATGFGAASSAQASASTNSLSTAAAAAAADGLFRNAAAAMGIRQMLPPPPSVNANLSSAPAFGNNATSNMALAANLAAAAERLRPVTPSGQAIPTASSLDAAYRTLMGLDGRGVGYDTALFRPPLMMDPLMFEREREQLIRLQQQQLFATTMHQDHSSTSANPLASMIDLERAMSRPGVMLSSAAPGLITQSPISSTVPFPGAQSSANLFNSPLLGGLDSATAAAAAAAAASLYSTGLFQRERLELEQQVRLLGGVGGQLLSGVPSSMGAAANNVDPMRLGFLGAAAGNPLADPFFSARAAALGNAGFPPNLGLHFGLGPASSAAPSIASNHLPASSSAAVGSLVHNNMISPFSNSLEQLARQKRDVLLASAAAAAATAPQPNVFQNR